MFVVDQFLRRSSCGIITVVVGKVADGEMSCWECIIVRAATAWVVCFTRNFAAYFVYTVPGLSAFLAVGAFDDRGRTFFCLPKMFSYRGRLTLLSMPVGGRGGELAARMRSGKKKIETLFIPLFLYSCMMSYCSMRRKRGSKFRGGTPHYGWKAICVFHNIIPFKYIIRTWYLLK